MKKTLILMFVALAAISFVSATNFVSDTTTKYYDGANWQSAVAAWVHPAWTTSVLGTWIWNAEYVSDNSALNGEAVTFQKTFEVGKCGENQKLTGTIDIASDNTFVLSLNGNVVDAQLGEHNYEAKHTYDLSPYLVDGENTLTIDATNLPLNGGVPTTNPAGIVFAGSANCGDNNVPEFGVIAGGIALIGAIAGIAIIRKRN